MLKENEFTVETLLAKIKDEHKIKANGSGFSKADIHDWANKQRIPTLYGGEYIKISKLGPLKILALSTEPFSDYSVEQVPVIVTKKEIADGTRV